MSAQHKCIKTGEVQGYVECFRAQVMPMWERIWLWLGVTPSDLVGWVSEEITRWRNTCYAPMPTLRMFMGQAVEADKSCKNAVARESAATGKARCQNTGPYCRARGRLPLTLIRRMVLESGECLRTRQPYGWRWHGMEVKLVDGTTLSMPDTPENQARFPQSRQQKPGLGFPVARLVALLSLSCGAVLGWATGPCKGKSSGETSMLQGLLSHFKAGDLFMGDRYYAGYFMLAMLLMQCGQVVVRQHQLRKTDFRRGKQLGKRDHIVDWPRPSRPKWMDKNTYATMPEQLTLREIRVGKWILVTSLLDAREFPRQEIAALYPQRWQIELDLRSIKSVMKMDILRCLTPVMVEKEIAIHLLAYNLIRAAMAQAAVEQGLQPRQISFKATMQLLRAHSNTLCSTNEQGSPADYVYDQILCMIADNRLPHRPGRVEPRVRKRRQSNYPLMTKPRNLMKKKLQKQKDREMSTLE